MATFNNSSFSPQQDRRFFREKGEWVQWYAGRKCSCSAELDPSRSNPNCRVCFGTGTFYAAPQWIIGLVAGISNSKMLLESGIGIPGDLVFSPPMMDYAHAIADQDQFKLGWDTGEAYDGDLIVRGATSSDRLIYEASEITAVTQSEPDTGVVTTYREGIDFTHATNSDTLVWLNTVSSVKPSLGSTYSVRYRANFVWIGMIPPAERRERGTSLGSRIILRRKHLVLAK